jgi:predicted  nucleic acid-binding Zn-ribbon protein
LHNLEIRQENLTIELSNLKSAKKSLEIQLNKTNQDFDMVNARKQKDLQTLDKLQDVKQIKAVQEELDHVLSRIEKLENSQLELMENQEQLDQNLAKTNHDLEDITNQIDQFENNKDKVLKVEKDKVEYMNNYFAEISSNLSANLCKIFSAAADENYGRAVVFYSPGNFEGLIMPLTAHQQQEISSIKDNEIAVLDDTNQIVVRINSDEISAIRSSL